MSEFTAIIHLKPYVARHLQNLYGDPVNLSPNRDLHRFFVDCLKRGDPEHTNKTPKQLDTPVKIKISEYEFYHYGWEISLTDVLALNNRVENDIKLMLRLWIGNYKIYGFPISKAIKDFQRIFDFPEDVFPYETIKKDDYRNGIKLEKDLMDEFLQKIQKTLAKNFEDFVPRSGQQILKNQKP